MKIFNLTIALSLLFLTTLPAQNNPQSAKQTPGENSIPNIVSTVEVRDIKVTGKVIDKDVNEPLEYATIAFFSRKENKIIGGGITDVEGNFSIEVPPGTYDIRVEYISYKTKTIPKPLNRYHW